MSRLSSDENVFKGDFYEAEQEADMHAFGAEDEDYYFQIAENLEDDRQFILISDDIVELLEGCVSEKRTIGEVVNDVITIGYILEV